MSKGNKTWLEKSGGLYISNDLKWNKHVSETICTVKANQCLGSLKRNLKVNSSALPRKAYMASLDHSFNIVPQNGTLEKQWYI